MKDHVNNQSSIQDLLTHELEFKYAKAKIVLPGIRRIVAPNPSPYTLHGTGTYIIGQNEIAVIDPGPNIESHIEAILGETKGEKITHIFFTSRRKMINKIFKSLFKNYELVAKELNINLSCRPGEISPLQYFKITEYFEKLI